MKKGFSALIVIFLLVTLIAGVLLLALAATNKKKVTDSNNTPAETPRIVEDYDESTALVSPPPISDSTDVDDMLKELDSTVVGSPENELKALDSSIDEL